FSAPRVTILRLHADALARCGRLDEAVESARMAASLVQRYVTDNSAALPALIQLASLLQSHGQLLEAEMITDQISDTSKTLDEPELASVSAEVLKLIAEGLERQGLPQRAEGPRRARLAALVNGPSSPDNVVEVVGCYLELIANLLDQKKIDAAREER